ncbi:hypothetical protein [Puniceibacterium sediminis]|nr:hypothetical protein [Puniceibacterium sediminis]
MARVRDRYSFLLRCRTCRQISIKPRNVVVDHTPECHHCIRRRREAAASQIGATLLGSDPDHRHYGVFVLECGHIVRRQYLRVEKAADGGHRAGCEACREAAYDEAASRHGWSLNGPAASGRTGYRSYRHHCGHKQNVSVGNMTSGDVDCARCGESWTSKPSSIYLFRIDLPSGSVLKLGYSSNPRKRLRHQLGIAHGTPTRILRTIPILTGHQAVCAEKSTHAWMRRYHPDLIVPKSDYGAAINTRTEIYRLLSAPILHGLLDRIERGLPPISL